jgi:hypothetical protein
MKQPDDVDYDLDRRWTLQRFRQEHEHSHPLEFPENCYVSGFEFAFDVETTPHQYCHITYKYPSGALCGTKLLWFHGGPLTEERFHMVDCPTCLHIWEKRGLSI